MNRVIYLTTLKRALSGMPAADVADVLGDCERHFLDGLAAGRDESAIAAGLGDPRKMAAELRAAMGVAIYERKSSFRNLLRLMSVTAGLASFNMTMLLPALILPLVILSSYLLSATAIVSGVLITASGITGIDHIATAPNRMLVVRGGGATVRESNEQLRLDVSNFGVRLSGPRMGGVDIAAGQSAPDSVRPFTRLRIAYGIVYFFTGLLLWRVSGRFGKVAMLGFANYLRLNRSLIKNAVTGRSPT